MNLLFLEDAWDDYLYWLNTDKAILKSLNELIKACMREPFSEIGKPEALKFDMSGCWSRRITAEHRLVYKVDDENIIIIQLRKLYLFIANLLYALKRA